MAKPLTKVPPSSSVAGMLQPGLGAQVLARPEPHTATVLPIPIQPQAHVDAPDRSQMRSFNEPIHVNRQFLLTMETDRTLKRLLDLYSQACGLDLKHSELFRALMLALA